MYVCQWHIDVPFGKQKEALEVMKKWDESDKQNPAFSKVVRETRRLVGHVGTSPTHIISEFWVESMGDWETMMKEVATGKFQKHSDAIAQLIVPGSQHWEILRVAN